MTEANKKQLYMLKQRNIKLRIVDLKSAIKKRKQSIKYHTKQLCEMEELLKELEEKI